MAELQNNLPPGWDSKIDPKTGKTYYINHRTKTTTWDNPIGVTQRIYGTPQHNQHGGSEYIPLQVKTTPREDPLGVRQRIHGTPQHSQHSGSEYIPLQDMRSSSRASTLLLKSSQMQESSLTNVPDPDESVTKISSMFPTVSDTHIRLLLKKYMKSIFPKAEETIILEVLSNNDNNIQKASDCLKGMGYDKKDPVKILQQQAEARQREEDARQEEINRIEIPLIPVIKTSEEKAAIRNRLKEQYKDISEQVIIIALDSVQYDESRASQVLQIMIQEDSKTNNNETKDETDEVIKEQKPTLATTTMPVSQSRTSFKSLLIADKNDGNKDKSNFGKVTEEKETQYKSANLSNTKGGGLAKGANEKLLLTDYITWHGPNPELRKGSQRNLAKGSNKANLSARTYKAQGPNSDLHKGPKVGLAKGSIFKQFRKMVIGESRGK